MSDAHEAVLEYGIKIGMENKSIEIAKKMIENGYSLKFIMDLTDLSLEQLKEITLNDK